MSRLSNNELYSEEKNHKCSVCGRMFPIPYYVREWGYWYAGRICCGYTCMRTIQAKDRPKMDSYVPEKEGRRNIPLTQTEIKNIEKLLFRGQSVRKTAKQVKRSEAVVGKIRKRLVAEGWIAAS